MITNILSNMNINFHSTHCVTGCHMINCLYFDLPSFTDVTSDLIESHSEFVTEIIVYKTLFLTFHVFYNTSIFILHFRRQPN